MSQTDGSTKTIGTDTYKVLMLDPLTASDLLLDLTNIFGPGVSAVISGIIKSPDSRGAIQQLWAGVNAKGEAVDQEDDVSAGGSLAVQDLLGDNLERAIVDFLGRLTREKQREIINTMMGVTSVQKGEKWPELKSVFDAHFRGRPKALYAWLGFALSTQYKDFFSP